MKPLFLLQRGNEKIRRPHAQGHTRTSAWDGILGLWTLHHEMLVPGETQEAGGPLKGECDMNFIFIFYIFISVYILKPPWHGRNHKNLAPISPATTPSPSGQVHFGRAKASAYASNIAARVL